MLRRLFARFKPRSQTHVFYERGLTLDCAAPGMDPPPVRWVESPDADAAPLLAQFCAAAGFGIDWHPEMLAAGCCAALAVDIESGRPMAMAWLTRGAFHVEEIGAIFDPAGGAYLFGDFVLPAFRGRGLQRLLVNQRLKTARQRGADVAYTIVHPDNLASVKSYSAEGFTPAATWTQRTWLGRTRNVLARTATAGAILKLDARNAIRAMPSTIIPLNG